MKSNLNLKKLSSSLLLLGFAITCTHAQAATPRVTLRGLTGSNSYADVDALVPLNATGNSLFYIDGQGRYDKDYESFGGLGLGYRSLQGCAIWGGDLFADYTTSNSHHYWVLSPGLETIRSCWDARVNGYIPLKERNNECSYFLSGPNECGIYGDTSFVEFSGHQEFEHRFLQFEEVGPGIDAAIGFNLPRFNCARLQGSLYYYRFDEAKDITGVGARLDVPINSNWAITSEASYDNVEHGAFTVGLSFQLGHTTKPGCCPTLCDRLYDQVYRHNGPVALGTGVPVQRSRKDEGLFLRRDNIYFFSENGSAVLGDSNAGTYENPFRDDQFSDATVGAVGTNANFYFASGDYNIDFFGDTRLTLADGLSLYGRSENFKSSVNGLDRPLLNGGLDIVGTTGHHIDSIRLEKIVTQNPGLGAAAIIGLSLEDGEAHICNTLIDVEAIVPGISVGENIAIGMTANDSKVTIDRSAISVSARIGERNTAPNSASAIGSYNADFANNIFVINDTKMSASTKVLDLNNSRNFAVGIGSNIISETDSFSFENNQFLVNCCSINVESRFSSISDLLMAAGIGMNGLTGLTSVMDFINNQFVIKNSTIEVLGEAASQGSNIGIVGIGNNAATAGVTNFNNNAFMIDNSRISSSISIDTNNAFLEIGGIGTNSILGQNNFNQNIFEINKSDITVVNKNDLANNSAILAFSIGNNAIDGAANFVENSFVLNKSLLNIISHINDNVQSDLTNIGINSDYASDLFAGNNFSISETVLNIESLINVSSLVTVATNIGCNAGTDNSAASFVDNRFDIDNHSNLNTSVAIVGDIFNNRMSNIGNQLESPSDGGATTFANNIFNISTSALTAMGVVGSTTSDVNLVYSINASDNDNDITLFSSSIDVLAQVRGVNNSSNTAIGLSALGANSVIRTFNSFIGVTALANSELNTATGKEGNVIDTDTIYAVVEAP